MIALVARRELVERARSRAFRVSLAILLIVVVGGIVAANLLGGGGSTLRVGLAGAPSGAAAGQVRQQAAQTGSRVRVATLADRAAAERELRDGRIDAALIDGRDVVVKTERAARRHDCCRRRLGRPPSAGPWWPRGWRSNVWIALYPRPSRRCGPLTREAPSAIATRQRSSGDLWSSTSRSSPTGWRSPRA